MAAKTGHSHYKSMETGCAALALPAFAKVSLAYESDNGALPAKVLPHPALGSTFFHPGGGEGGCRPLDQRIASPTAATVRSPPRRPSADTSPCPLLTGEGSSRCPRSVRTRRGIPRRGCGEAPLPFSPRGRRWIGEAETDVGRLGERRRAGRWRSGAALIRQRCALPPSPPRGEGKTRRGALTHRQERGNPSPWWRGEGVGGAKRERPALRRSATRLPRDYSPPPAHPVVRPPPLPLPTRGRGSRRHLKPILSPPPCACAILPSPITQTGRPSGGVPVVG